MKFGDERQRETREGERTGEADVGDLGFSHFNSLLSMGIMENAVVLLCKRGDVSCGVLLERTLSFQSLMTKLFAKWKDLSEGSFSLSYSFAGHPKCLLETDEDLCVLYALTLSSRTECVDVAVKDLVDTNSVGAQVDLLPSFSGNNKSKVLKSAGWCNAIVGVGQVFLDGAVGFRDALSMYSLFHGFKYVYAKNDAQTVKAVCLERHTSKECNWIVKAKLEMPSGYFIIKQFVASNPDSMCVLERHDSEHFKRMFLGFAACKYGFTFCRPILFVDGTFLKSTHNGCLLWACAKDGNQGNISLSFLYKQ
ncbi:hypothetical protein C3L33_18372, partial [Rhododendron williamsianum]